VHACAADNERHLVTDLSKDVFRVLENGVEQQLKLFRREDIPVSVGVVIDNSGSMKNSRKRVEAASINNDEAILDVTTTSERHQENGRGAGA
jgi:Ca-activated chloride channel homolog